jgi:methylenetetrahydrofolate--tRNA-(uracil-5-)-methyltransferase
MDSVKIIGGGLAGCEAALQLSNAGFLVELIDAKPQKLLPVYQLKSYCELICNNSLGNVNSKTPLGLLLAELDFLGSYLLSIAKNSMVKDDKTISVDKILFSMNVTTALQDAGVNFTNAQVVKLPETNSPLIIATGALTDEILAKEISQKYNLPFYTFADASCPVIEGASIDFENKYLAKISDDLFALSVPFNDYNNFFMCLQNSSPKSIHEVEFFDSFTQCKSLEKIAGQGIEMLTKERFSPDGYNQPTLFLRRESGLRDAFILVGCTTGLGHKEQHVLFSLLPSFENIKFIRYGRQHRNTYFKMPGNMDSFFKILNANSDVYIIGQLSGLDGYAPAIASGYVAAQHIINPLKNKLPIDTMIGALSRYVSDTNIVDYQPMCASFSLLPNIDILTIKEHSINALVNWKESNDISPVENR